MPAGQWDPVIEQGADWFVTVEWTDEAGQPVTPQAPCYMQLRDAAGAAAATLSTDNGGIAIAGGVLTLALPAATTAALVANWYDTDLFVTDPTGHTVRLLAGLAQVVARVSTPT
jgi:hypothetical protein